MITAEQLEQIANLAGTVGDLNDDLMEVIKLRWPDLRFTLCSDEDMPARLEPALKKKHFNLYLVGSSEHCLSLTDDFQSAIGVVVALVDEE